MGKQVIKIKMEGNLGTRHPGRTVGLSQKRAMGMVLATSILCIRLVNDESITFFSPAHIAYCQVSAGRGCKKRPTGFPPGLERLLQNGEFPEGSGLV